MGQWSASSITVTCLGACVARASSLFPVRTTFWTSAISPHRGPMRWPHSPLSMRLGLRVAAHDFFHGLLFYSGLELLHLTLGGILHIAVFIMLCEAFLGLWKHFFHIGVEGRPLLLVGGAPQLRLVKTKEYLHLLMATPTQGGRASGSWFRSWRRSCSCCSCASGLMGLGPYCERVEEVGGDLRPSQGPVERESYRGGRPTDLLRSEGPSVAYVLKNF
jgi:hypothetical protein